MTKRTLALTVGATVLAANSALADGPRYPSRDAPVACCEATWNGFYLGGSVGVAASITRQTDIITRPPPPAAPPPPPEVDPFDGLAGRGFLGSVVIGYDRQVGPGIVIGVFTDYDFTDAEFTHTNNLRETIRVNDIWSVGARIGLVRDCCALWYVTAGYTNADFKYHLADTTTYNFNSRLDGWFTGIGVEQQIGRGLALKLEYRYGRFEDSSFSFVDGGGSRHDVTKEPELHSVRLGLAYKFDLGRGRDIVPLK
jgi:opacity protein-like surface antigen